MKKFLKQVFAPIPMWVLVFVFICFFAMLVYAAAFDPLLLSSPFALGYFYSCGFPLDQAMGCIVGISVSAALGCCIFYWPLVNLVCLLFDLAIQYFSKRKKST